MNIDQQYLQLLQDLLDNGELKENRTGVDTKAIAGYMLQHDMSEGFPLLTTKKVFFNTMATELEGFIKGITDKKWFQDRGCHIWDNWCNPQKVPYGNDDESKAGMLAEKDLGPIYGAQWRGFSDPEATDSYGFKISIDQLKKIVDTLKTNPMDRRMVCSAWNPLAIDQMALPPCHLLWQVTVIAGKLNLAWYQRSCDVPVGIPFNIASYGLLLKLLALGAGLEEGRLIGFLMDTHYYVDQEEGIREQLTRQPRGLPKVLIDKNEAGFDIFEWQAKQASVFDYNPHPVIKFALAV